MSDIIPPEFWQGVEQFNSGQFYACHDTLEALWIEASEPEKTFYQGILQIAVAQYHLSNCNWKGAVILLGEGSNRLRRFPSVYISIDVDQLLSQAATLLSLLQQM
jgi:predicted metal-dependent hydrolase